MNNDKIVTPSFCYILAANFLLFFAFYLILPILPFYLKEEFMIGKSMIGFILSCYTLAALCIRPFAGYLLDTFARRPLYLVAYFIFTAIFGGYMVATALTLFIALRVVHGFAFGMVTVAGNTILIDILPSSRRGEGIGYYGLANNIAMSFGPMIGLFMQGNFTYDVIFSCSLLSGSLVLSWPIWSRLLIATGQTRTDLPRPLFLGEGNLGGYLPIITLHSLWYDYHLCSDVRR